MKKICENCNKNIKKEYNLYYYKEKHYLDSVECVFELIKKLNEEKGIPYNEDSM